MTDKRHHHRHGRGVGANGSLASRWLPTSLAQSRLYVLTQLDPASSVAYNFFIAVALRGSLDRPALTRALQHVVERHEALRTGFAMHDDVPCRHVAEAVTVSLPLRTLAAADGADRCRQLEIAARREFGEPFDLERPPLLRAKLIQFTEDDHVLLLTVHHIVFDAWSWALLWRDLSASYNACLRGAAAAPLPPAPCYGRHVLAERAMRESGRLRAQEDYWRKVFSEAPPALDIKTDRPRPPRQSFEGATASGAMEDACWARLRALALRTRTSPFVVALAAFKALLFRITEQEDVTVGAPFAGRREPESKEIVGLFLNTLALRTQVGGNPSFLELIERVGKTVFGAYANQDCPFEQIIQFSKAERTLDRSPVFQAMLMFRDVAIDRASLTRLDATIEEIARGTTKYDLTLSIAADSGDGRVNLEYNSRLFDRATAARLVSNYLTLIAAAVAHPEMPIGELPLESDTQLARTLIEWNETSDRFQCAATLRDLVEAQVARSPDACAVECGDERISYRTLDERANIIADRLRRLQIGRGNWVGVCLPRSIEAVCAIIGILKAGAAFVPLDPAYPNDRLIFMLRNCRARVVITTTAQNERVTVDGVATLCIDRPAESAQLAMRGADGVPEDAAYLIYTSGSTGQPKGVLGTHKGMVNRLQWMWKRYPFRDGEVCCQRTPLNFVDSIPEIFGAVGAGVKLVIVPDDILQTPARFVGLLAERRVTRLFVVPSLLRLLLELFPDLGAQLPELRYVISSGEALVPDLVHKMVETLRDCALLNLYGSSEVLDATWFEVPAGAAERGYDRQRAIPIGRPTANMRIYILDPRGRPVPPGVPGEIYVAGDNLARGYHARDDLTAERFLDIALPLGRRDRVFKTGDIGCYQTDGEIDFLGRRDSLVKVRGCRVETLEVQSALEQHDAVAEAAVVVRHRAPGEQMLVAYIRPESGRRLVPDDVRRSMAERLPSYMVPDVVVALEAWPRLPNGKVDWERLPVPAVRRDALPVARALDDPTEQAIAGLWKDLLGVRQVDRGDTFVGLGGHSLLAMKFVTLAEKRLGMRFDPTKVLVKTLGDLAASNLAAAEV
jgi:amino acid adenylation domain-containing protein